MPARYEAIKASILAKGNKSLKAAKTSAAKIYNATRKQGEPSLQTWIATHEGSPPNHRRKGK